jgi:hypothetical protein
VEVWNDELKKHVNRIYAWEGESDVWDLSEAQMSDILKNTNMSSSSRALSADEVGNAFYHSHGELIRGDMLGINNAVSLAEPARTKPSPNLPQDDDDNMGLVTQMSCSLESVDQTVAQQTQRADTTTQPQPPAPPKKRNLRKLTQEELDEEMAQLKLKHESFLDDFRDMKHTVTCVAFPAPRPPRRP